MNILPLVLAVAFILVIVTVERLEKFKNHTIVQEEYKNFLLFSERAAFNQRQKNLFKDYQRNIRQLSFRYVVNKKSREANENGAKQYRLLLIELMKIVYGEAAFYKELERRRPDFLNEMLTKVQEAADAAPKKTIKRIEDIARLQLNDPELHEAFYRMLKGTLSRKQWLQEKEEFTPHMKEKAYLSLFNFINYNGKNNSTPPIHIRHAPREILKAIFVKDEIVDAIIAKRKEFTKKETSPDALKIEFINQRRPGLEDNLLDFTLSRKVKDEYD